MNLIINKFIMNLHAIDHEHWKFLYPLKKIEITRLSNPYACSVSRFYFSPNKKV